MDRLRPFTVGEWRVHPDLNELQRGTERVRVQPRLIQLLRQLALAGGRTVTRESLLDSAWSRRMVNDEVLSRTVADLRAALGDDARQPRYLETIPKVGYRLLAEVSWHPPDEAGAAPENPAEPRTSEAIAAAASADRPAIAGPADELPEPAGGAPAAAPSPSPSIAAALALLAAMLALAWWALRIPEPLADANADLRARLLLAQPLTSAPGWELTPRLAPRGDLIAWSETMPGAAGATIRLRSRDGRVDRTLTDGSAYDVCPTFAPDASELVWTRHSEGACELLRAPLLGGTPQRLAACAPGVLSCPDWLEGALLYTAPAAAAEHAAGLARLRLHDGRIERLSSPPIGSGNDTHPRVSGDGRVAFLRGEEGDRSLWLLAADGREQHPGFAASMAYGLAWLDQAHVLLASDALGFRALLAVEVASGEATLLGARGARYPDVGVDGAVVFEHASYDANLWLHAPDAAPQRLTASSRYDAYPRLAPDGQRVVYQSNRDGNESLYLLDLASREEIRLPLEAATRWAQPAWLADGSGLTLTRYAPGGVELWRYALGAQAPLPLPAPAGAQDAQADPDGVHVWARVGGERAAELLRFRLDGAGSPERLQAGIEHYQVDRQGLFLVRADDARLHWCADFRSCTPLPVELADGQRRNWALADGALYYVDAGNEDSATVDRYALADGSRTRIPWPRPGALSRAIDVSRDGHKAVIARTDRIDVDLQWVSPSQQALPALDSAMPDPN